MKIKGGFLCLVLGFGLAALSLAYKKPSAPPAESVAPELSGITHWLNAEKPATLESLKGKVVLVAFWTHGCSNCIHTLPRLNSWYSKYKDRGFEIVGVHTPEFGYEKEPDNVRKAIRKFGIQYPVAMDDDYATWKAYSNHYWPAHYFVDRKGIIRYQHAGEGDYDASEKWIETLLAEKGGVMTEKATFGAGCFWGVEATFRSMKGVLSTQVGYTGGSKKNPTYEDVCEGDTGHAEAVEVTYDPAQVSYDRLLAVFWENHDPTTFHRQGPDVGSQYRSAIFFHSPEQKEAAARSKEKLWKTGAYQRPIVTEIVQAGEFYRAEEYHQQYLEKRGLASCHIR